MKTMNRTPALPATDGSREGLTDQRVGASTTPGRSAAFTVAGFLAAFLPLNTYWAAGGTWGLAWVLGCAGCTVPLALVWMQEAMLLAGIVVVLGRAGLLPSRLPAGLWRLGLWTMAAAFAAVGAQNLLGDNTPQARFLFAPVALGLCVLSAVANLRLARPDNAKGTTEAVGGLPPAATWAPAAPPRWARRAATLTVLTTIPSGLWRTSMAVGVPVGVDGDFRRAHYGFPGWGTVWVFGLTLLLVGLAFLTLGLVRRWGEVTPRWMPFIGGKRVPRLAALIPAGTGAVAVTLLWVLELSNLGEIFVVYGLEGVERIVVIACYAPLLLWGPLLAAVTVSYARRTRVRPRLDPAALVDR